MLGVQDTKSEFEITSSQMLVVEHLLHFSTISFANIVIKNLTLIRLQVIIIDICALK